MTSLLRSAAVRVALVTTLLVLALAGCEDRTRNEAKLFLSKVADVDENAPTARRREEIQALKDLVVTTDEIRTAQRACVHAHEALLHAEEEQEGARHALEEAAHRVGTHTALTAADSAAIQANIDASNRDIAEARTSFPTCTRHVDELKRKYGEGSGN